MLEISKVNAILWFVDIFKNMFKLCWTASYGCYETTIRALGPYTSKTAVYESYFC